MHHTTETNEKSKTTIAARHGEDVKGEKGDGGGTDGRSGQLFSFRASEVSYAISLCLSRMVR